MEEANKFMEAYKRMKSDFMKKHLSTSVVSKEGEDDVEYEYISGDENDSDASEAGASSCTFGVKEDDTLSVDSVPVESLFQKDSSDSDSDSDFGRLPFIMNTSSFYRKKSSNDGSAGAIVVSEKEIRQREMKQKEEENKMQLVEWEKSQPCQTFKYWKVFEDVAPRRSEKDVNIVSFYENLHGKWIPQMTLSRKDSIYHYLEKAGSETKCHLIPTECMTMILTQSEFPYEWQLLLREIFPKTFNPHTRQINTELYYRYVDSIIKKYDEDESEEGFVQNYVLLNVLLVIFVFRHNITYFVQKKKIDPSCDIHSRPSIEERNEIISQFGFDYQLLFQLGLWLSECYENEVYPYVYDIYQMAILMTS